MSETAKIPNVTRVLATDLDGTLIPLCGNDQNQSDLQLLGTQLREHDVALVFVTGRHFDSVIDAIDVFSLPTPDWIICNVGTEIFQRQPSGEFLPIKAYERHLDELVAAMPEATLREHVAGIDGLSLQPPQTLSRFKLSFFADADRVDELVSQLQGKIEETAAPYSIIHSIDPYTGVGLIDLLPAGVSKAHALDWWGEQAALAPDSIVFAGDSGNDLAALTAGHRAIVVANANHRVIQRAYNQHREAGWRNRLFLSKSPATSGVLEGCRWFEFLPPFDRPVDRLGATPVSVNRTHFRVWAPKRRSVAVEILDGQTKRQHALTGNAEGYYTGTLANTGPHTRYRYLLDGEHAFPDPASRYQPEGVHGPAEVIDPNAFSWTDSAWKGIARDELIIYELHIGTFTEKGTFRAAIERLGELLALGITAVEVMPVAQSPGRWNWGYDGVDLFAPRNTYGEPDDFRAFVDACHAAGLAVLLDVVYNHLGPEGNYLGQYGPYFSEKHHTPWGEAFNYDDDGCEHVRSFIIHNALFWLEEFHLDGLRLDAVHLMFDDGVTTILDDIRQSVSRFREVAQREIHLITEANVYDDKLLPADGNREAYDAIWCDCLMHTVYSTAVPDLRLTERAYCGAGDLAEVLARGYLYYHDKTKYQRATDAKRNELQRGREVPRDGFVISLQNHDGVGNHPLGKRLHQLASKQFQRAAAPLALLQPSIPLIFMGEASAAESPFPFFVDFEDPALQQAIDEGRAKEYPQHVWGETLRPSQVETFQQAKLPSRDIRDEEMFRWYQALIALRKQGLREGWLSAETMQCECRTEDGLFSLSYRCDDGGEIAIHVRLCGESDQQAVTIPLVGEVLLSSLPDTTIRNQSLTLQTNHAVITRLQ